MKQRKLIFRPENNRALIKLVQQSYWEATGWYPDKRAVQTILCALRQNHEIWQISEVAIAGAA